MRSAPAAQEHTISIIPTYIAITPLVGSAELGTFSTITSISTTTAMTGIPVPTATTDMDMTAVITTEVTTND